MKILNVTFALIEFAHTYGVDRYRQKLIKEFTNLQMIYLIKNRTQTK